MNKKKSKKRDSKIISTKKNATDEVGVKGAVHLNFS